MCILPFTMFKINGTLLNKIKCVLHSQHCFQSYKFLPNEHNFGKI